MTSFRVFKSTIANVALYALFSLASASAAHARSFGAQAGKTWPAQPCVNEFYGGLINNCSAQVVFTMALPVDSPGWKTVTATVNGSSGPVPFISGLSVPNNVSCYAYGTDAPITSVWQSQTFSIPSPSTGNYGLTLTGANGPWVPSGGNLNLVCFVDPKASVRGVNYNP